MTGAPSATDLLVALAEPTRLRILNCLAAAPLFVSDLQAVMGIPQPTVSRHLKVLRDLDVVRDTPVAQFVLYRLRRGSDLRGRLVATVLEAVGHDERMRTERHRALDRSRSHTRLRTDMDPQENGEPESRPVRGRT